MTSRLAQVITEGEARARRTREAAVEQDARRSFEGDTIFLDKGPSLPATIRTLMNTGVIHTQVSWR